MVRKMKVERNTAVRSAATARRSGTVGAVAASSAQVVSGQAVVSASNQGGLTVSDLSSLNPTPPQFLLSPGQQSYLTSSGTVAQLAPMQQQMGQPQQQQILLSNMNEMPAQKLIRRGHQLELLTEAKILCDRQNFVDLTIYCEDGVVRAHQMLLAVASPFLMLLFQSNPSYENDDITLILPEVKACLVQALIHFVYTGVVVSNENHFYSLMKLVYALNINASIEAESTNDRATTFTAPLVSPSSLNQVLRLPHQQSNHHLQQQVNVGHQQNLATLPQQLLPQQPVPLNQSLNGGVTTANSSNVNAVAAAAVAAITQPAIAPPNLVPPPSKAPRLSGPPANAVPVPIQNLGQSVAGQTSKLPIQLPTQPVPMVNGVIRGTEQGTHHVISNASAAPTQQYIAIDPITGINYKVDMSLSSGEVGSDPLAAIMNETIFQDTSGAIVPAPNAQIYQTDSGQVIYTTQPPPNATATIPTNIQIQQPQPLTSSPVQLGKRGKKRGAVKQEGSPLNNNSSLISNTVPASVLSSVQIVGDHSVDDLPCTPDDEDINTPYPCPSCNKTIKGKVMLQAHHFQEHYDNPELNQVDIGDKHACRVCLKLFTRNSDVKAHILRVHCGDRRYPCTMCGKRFKESTHLRKHLYTHTGERPHFCSLCSKGFQTSSDLKRHKRTRVHQERVEQGGGIEPESVDSPPPSVARKSAPATDGGSTAVTSSIANTSIASADGSLSATTTRWSDDEEMNESETMSPNASANTAQVILSSITEPVALVGSETSAAGQLIVPTTTSAARGTITDPVESIVNSDRLASSDRAASDIMTTTATTTTANWTGSGGGIITTTNASSTSSAATAPLDLKELTSASDMNAFIESATENMASAAAAASTSGNGDSGVSMTMVHAPLMSELDTQSGTDSESAMTVKMEIHSMDSHHNNGMQVQGIDDVLLPSDAAVQESRQGTKAATPEGNESSMHSISMMKQSTVSSASAIDSPSQDEGEQRLTAVEAPENSSQEPTPAGAESLLDDGSTAPVTTTAPDTNATSSS